MAIFIPTNGIRLHGETAGPENGPLLLLLHGFPEFWYGWKNQIGPLGQAGFFTVALDQRGYNLSDKPREVSAYRLEVLARDVTGVCDYFGRDEAILIGHDWGAAVAWHVAIHAPTRVAKLAILNVPHPAAMARALATLTRQVLRSWYIYFFQIPALPELLLSSGRYAPMRRMLRASARPDTFTAEDLRRYTEAWSQPGALAGMINWYRAAGRATLALGQSGNFRDSARRVTVPTLILWGEQDVALIPEMASWSLEQCDQGTLVHFPHATHWVQHDEAGQVNEHLLWFLTSSG